MRPLLGSLLFLATLAGCKAPITPTPVSNTPSPSPRAVQPASQAASEDTMPQRAASQRPRSRRSRPSATSQPGVFDFYLLNLSWSPEFCATHSSPECASHPGFVVHGLWPQNTNGTYPENCSTAPGPSNPQGDTDLQPTVSLVEHEWQTHGTCSGLAADPYFSLIRSAFHEIRIPANFVHVQHASSVAPATILNQFAAANPGFPVSSFALSCGNNALTAIEVCLTKDLHALACPNLRSCAATTIKVVPQ